MISHRKSSPAERVRQYLVASGFTVAPAHRDWDRLVLAVAVAILVVAALVVLR